MSSDSDVVEHVVRTIAQNTGKVQPQAISAQKIRLHLVAHGPYDSDDVLEGIETAVAEGRLVKDNHGFRLPESEP